MIKSFYFRVNLDQFASVISCFRYLFHAFRGRNYCYCAVRLNVVFCYNTSLVYTAFDYYHLALHLLRFTA